MIHASHNKRGRKSHLNVGTFLPHVSTQTPMYQSIVSIPEEPSLWYILDVLSANDIWFLEFSPNHYSLDDHNFDL